MEISTKYNKLDISKYIIECCCHIKWLILNLSKIEGSIEIILLIYNIVILSYLKELNNISFNSPLEKLNDITRIEPFIKIISDKLQEDINNLNINSIDL